MHARPINQASRGRRAAVNAAVAGLLATIALLILPPLAKANFVYWANAGQTTIGRAKINGTGLNNSFIGGLSNLHGVAVDSKFIYWTQGSGATSTIGRANLDGSGAESELHPQLGAPSTSPPVRPQAGIAVNGSAIYWVNTGTAPNQIGRANLDGSGPSATSINPGGDPVCGIAADQSFIYWLDRQGSVRASGGRTPTARAPRRTSFPA